MPRLKIVQRFSGARVLSDDPGWEPRFDHDGRICAYTRTDDESGWVHLPGLASYRFSNRDDVIEAFPERDAPRDAITEAFHRVALPMALHASGYEVLHASAVSDAGGVHVFCGASRSGKSTIAYLLARRGYGVWADDAVAFARDARGGIKAVPLPFALRLRREVIDFFEVPAVLAKRRANGKIELMRDHAVGARPIASVSLLERGSSSAIAKLSASESLPAVLYHAFYFSLDDRSVRRMATQFLGLIAAVPLFRVTLGTGLENMTALLDQLEQRALAPTSG